MTILPAPRGPRRVFANSRIAAGLGGGLTSLALAASAYAFVEANRDPDVNCHGPCTADLLIPLGAIAGTAIGTWLVLRLAGHDRVWITTVLAVLLAPPSVAWGMLGSLRLVVFAWMAAPFFARWLVTYSRNGSAAPRATGRWQAGMGGGITCVACFFLVALVIDKANHGVQPGKNIWLQLLASVVALVAMSLGTWLGLRLSRQQEAGRTAALAAGLAIPLALLGWIVGGSSFTGMLAWFAAPVIARWLLTRPRG